MANPRQMLKDMVNTIKLAKKSDKDDYMQHLRLVLLGIATVGAIGFIIQFVFSVINYGHR
ncbi:MAG: protein translocase SEC61 complex subunit gamma [Thaumarchaeota archaeon]|nr:MAG: protein translocase SEC61 complex subunit gamma [Nitrososphaerota archaeon]